MQQAIVLTVMSPDRTGIVKNLSAVLTAHGGSWHRSSMSRLAGHFAGILEGDLPEDRVDECLAAFRALEVDGTQIVVRAGKPADPETHGDPVVLEIVGNDRSGIVAQITAALADQQVEVRSLETLVEGASMAGGELFRVYAQLELPPGGSVAALREALEAIADDLMIDLDRMN